MIGEIDNDGVFVEARILQPLENRSDEVIVFSNRVVVLRDNLVIKFVLRIVGWNGDFGRVRFAISREFRRVVFPRRRFGFDRRKVGSL